MKKEVIIDEFDFLTGDGYIHGMIYDKCKQILPENTPEIMEGNHSIYHYTHVEGLKNILKNENLWFTHIHYLNDREEVNVGANHYIQCNKEILEAEREINPNIPSFSVDTSNLHTYVCCFSLEKDALPMWNYYTKDASNKGYNIGFDYRKLMASLITKNP